MDECQRVKFDVIGLSETKRKEPLTATWRDGSGVFLGARKEDSISGGVGFIVAPHFLHRVRDARIVSHRLAVLEFEVSPQLTGSLIQAYAPVLDADEQEHDDFYDNLSDTVRECRSHYKFISGDFNARVGPRQDHEVYLGPHSTETRNESGERLAAFCEAHRLYHCNGFFEKRAEKRWTHASPNGAHLHELDHFLSNRRCVTDVAVVPSFSTGSDHRLLRAKIHLSLTRAKLDLLRSRQPRRRLLNPSIASTLAKLVPFDTSDDVNEDYCHLVETISQIGKQAMAPAPNHSTKRISDQTRKLLEKRRTADRTTAAYHALCKECREAVQKDHKEFERSRLLSAAEARKSIKSAARDLAEYRSCIPCLKTSTGERVTSRLRIEEEMQDYYSRLFQSSRPSTPRSPTPPCSTLPFLTSEVRAAVEGIPQGKAPGADGISAELLKACGHPLFAALASRFSRYLHDGVIPKMWHTSRTIILFKKGDREDLANYRPITLLSVIYKVFTRCVLARIRRTLEEAQPVEQAGFRRSFSTMDHIATVQHLLEVSREHQSPLVLTFIDYEKAFDSVEPECVWESLRKQGVEEDYVHILQECYDGCTTTLIPFQREVPVAVGKGVRQGDPISPNLFSAVLEDVISHCNWEERGILINGRRLSHLRFADDIVLVTSTPHEASEMLAELDIASHAVGLKMNTKKTKAMRNCFATSTPITVGATQLEDVDEYVYLGRLINSQNKLKPELARRRRAGWAAFSSIRTVIDSTKDVKLRAQLFDSTVLPALCYGAETWSLTKSLANQLRVAHASLERRLVGLNLRQQRDRKLHNSDIRQMSGVKDPLQHVSKMKHRWAGHVARRCDGRWSTTTVGWYPRDKKRPLGRPPTRWADSLAAEYNIRDARGRTRVHWTTRARDRVEWSRCWDPRAS